MQGPDIDQLEAVLWATSLDVVASGGVGELSDLEDLARLRAAAVDGGPARTLAGVIVGKALYEGRFTVEEALSCLAPV
jgi:phosphoribosylformimino-5-aminoimidazole carboxamide ribonucleotide (ProFAR) isomerase